MNLEWPPEYEDCKIDHRLPGQLSLRDVEGIMLPQFPIGVWGSGPRGFQERGSSQGQHAESSRNVACCLASERDDIII